MTNDYNTIYKINIENKTSDDKYIINFPNKINKILVENAIFTSKIIYEYYKYFNGLNDNTYTNQRRIIYLYVFNDILNINNTDIIKQMYTYNKILYNALIQYECYNYYHYATTLPINIQLSLILNSIYNDISPLFQNRNLNVNNRLNNFE